MDPTVHQEQLWLLNNVSFRFFWRQQCLLFAGYFVYVRAAQSFST